jgi:2-amino-4-hydroxy-6-hydroxymethyldihydropteridine diphosphokinase
MKLYLGQIKKPKFINIVFNLIQNFHQKNFNIFKSIEKKLGRKKTKKNSPRTCDIDIISYIKKFNR